MHHWLSLMQGSSLKVRDHTILGNYYHIRKQLYVGSFKVRDHTILGNFSTIIHSCYDLQQSQCMHKLLYVCSISSGGGGSEGGGGGRVSLSGLRGLGTNGGHSNMTHTHTHTHTLDLYMTFIYYTAGIMNMIILYNIVPYATVLP